MKTLLLILLIAVSQAQAGGISCTITDAYGNTRPCHVSDPGVDRPWTALSVPMHPGAGSGIDIPFGGVLGGPKTTSNGTSWDGGDGYSSGTCENPAPPRLPDPFATPAPSPTPTTPPKLYVTMQPYSGGYITSSGAISCPGTCSQDMIPGVYIELYAEPAYGYRFVDYVGCPQPSGSTCGLTMGTERESIIARFEADEDVYGPFEPYEPPTDDPDSSPPPANLRLDVVRSPSTGGSVSGLRISCGSDCSDYYAAGEGVTLTASPNSGCSVDRWTGCNASSGNTCSITMMTARTATVYFNCGGGTSPSPSPTPSSCHLSCFCGDRSEDLGNVSASSCSSCTSTNYASYREQCNEACGGAAMGTDLVCNGTLCTNCQ